MAGVGLFEQAISTAERINSDLYRCLAFTSIALMQIEKGLDPAYCIDQAFRAASKMHDDEDRPPIVAARVEAFSKVAIAQAKAGIDCSFAMKEAGEMTKSLESSIGDFSHGVALTYLALAQATIGLRSEAFASAENIMENPHAMKVRVFAMIGAIQAKSGDDSSEAFNRAFAAAGVYDDGMFSRAMEMIATAQADAGLLNQAHETVNKMLKEDLVLRSSALCAIGIAEAKAGVNPLETFKLAHKASDETSGFRRVYSFVNLAIAQGDAAGIASAE